MCSGLIQTILVIKKQLKNKLVSKNLSLIQTILVIKLKELARKRLDRTVLTQTILVIKDSKINTCVSNVFV